MCQGASGQVRVIKEKGQEFLSAIRAGLPNLSYPTTLPHPEGRLTTLYYAQDPDGITRIQSTTVERTSQQG